MVDINELRDRAATFGSDYLTDEEWVEVIDRLEAAEKAVAEAYQRGYATGQEEVEKERDALRAENHQYQVRLRKILEEPENTMSNSKALAEVIRQARIALGVKK